jgi:hypothetical protein
MVLSLGLKVFIMEMWYIFVAIPIIGALLHFFVSKKHTRKIDS